MRYSLLILAHALVVSSQTSIKDDIYQIQGVVVDDGVNNAVNLRRKRQALQSVQPTLASSDSLLRNPRHISGSPPLPPQLQQQTLQQQQIALQQQLQQLQQQQALLQQQQQKQQGQYATAPQQQQQQQQLQKLATNGVAATTLQQPGILSQLPLKPVAPAAPGGLQQQQQQKQQGQYSTAPQQLQQQQQQNQAILQQPQQKQQGQYAIAPLQKLATNGFAATSLQETGLLSQLPTKPGAPVPAPVGQKWTGPTKKTKSSQYSYPERMRLPLPICFHNPTGYVCCNEELNDLMVDVWTTLEQRPKFQPCNVHLIATHIQLNAQRLFNTSFEVVVSYDDFAQKINFRGDMVCKIELGNRFMLAYATASDAYNHDLAGLRREKRETNEEFSWSAGIAESWHSIHSSLF